MSKKRLRVVVVDDSSLFRVLIRDVLRKIAGVSIVGNAENGMVALEKIAELDPDIVTLDVEMPGMNGMEVLQKMKARGDRARVIMVSRHTAAGARVTTDALMEGAFDFVLKPSGSNIGQNKRELQDALEGILEAANESFIESVDFDSQAANVIDSAIDDAIDNATAPKEPPELADATRKTPRYELVLIGTSTGGPEALRQILPALPAHFRAPVLVVQHMPPKYTSSLASRLNDICPLEVSEATNGALIQPGKILFAPGGQQMGMANVNGRLVIRLTDDPPENSCRPAVDYLFRSAFETAPLKKMLGLILTGMGRDGTEGCALLKDCGGRVVVQHPEGCVVNGMPKSVIDRGLADYIIPLDKIAAAVRRSAE